MIVLHFFFTDQAIMINNKMVKGAAKRLTHSRCLIRGFGVVSYVIYAEFEISLRDESRSN